jgi:hypothetical protein
MWVKFCHSGEPVKDMNLEMKHDLFVQTYQVGWVIEAPVLMAALAQVPGYSSRKIIFGRAILWLCFWSFLLC